MPRWLWTALGCFLVSLLLAQTVNIYGFRLKEHYAAGASGSPVFRAAVVAGTPLHWRTLLKARRSFLTPDGTEGGILAGHFLTGKTDQQLLWIGRKEGRVFEASGASTAVGIHGAGMGMNVVGWDYNHDGVDEIVPDATIYSLANTPRSVLNAQIEAQHVAIPDTTPVLAIDGRIIAHLPDHTIAGFATVGDFDGDGWQEIGFPPTTFGKPAPLHLYGAGGKLAGTIALGPLGTNGVATETNHEGRCDFLRLELHPERLVGYRLNGTTGTITASSNTTDFLPLAADSAGESGEECVIFATGFMVLASQKVTRFAKPNPRWEHFHWARPCMLNLPGFTTPVIAMPEMDGVHLFDTGGQLVYQEDFDQALLGLSKLRAGRRDYLIVQTEECILIYP